MIVQALADSEAIADELNPLTINHIARAIFYIKSFVVVRRRFRWGGLKFKPQTWRICSCS